MSRAEYAARAILPVALSALCGYARVCLDNLKTVVPESGGPVDRTKIIALELPQIPEGAISTIRDVVTFADLSHRKEIADLAAALQVQEARLVGLREQSAQPHHILFAASVYRRMIDAAKLYARASALFSYGRRVEEEDKVALGPDAVRSALRNCRVYEGEYPELDRLVDDVDEDALLENAPGTKITFPPGI